MKRTSRISSALLVAVTVAVAPVRWSGGPMANVARADDKAEAQKLLTDGNQAAGDGDYLLALERFQAAYQRFKSPKILLNIGTMLRQLGRNVEAAGVYESYQRDPGADPARARDLVRILKEIDAVVGRVRVTLNRPDASVRLDGRELPSFVTGTVLRVEPGEHTLVANHAGFPPAVVVVQVAPREEALVVLRVVPPEERTIVVERVFTGPQRTIGVVLGAVGIGGLAAGGVAGAIAAVKNHAAAAHCRENVSCDAQGVSLGSTAKTSATVSTIALSAGGGLFATGLILYLTAPRRKVTGELPGRLAAGVSSQGAALRWEGAF